MEAIINLKPVAIVVGDFKDIHDVTVFGTSISKIEVFDEWKDCMINMEEHSHFWILSWMHLADRSVKKTLPRVSTDAKSEFGVFGLRAFSRPNPIGLSLVELLKKEGNTLIVSGLDLIDGTPILDIKPYFEPDTIFSPKSPYLRPEDPDMRMRKVFKDAINHHKEKCRDLFIACRMALVCEEKFKALNISDLIVYVRGTRCLADSIQGITRARFSNPERFTFYEDASLLQCIFTKDKKQLTVTFKNRDDLSCDDISSMPSDDLFNIEPIDI